MSYDIWWEFIVVAEHRAAFEKAYGSNGEWSQLFQKACGFIEVKLFKCSERSNRYVTIDRWQTEADFGNFRHQFASEYESLDLRFKELTSEETRIGAFYETGSQIDKPIATY